MINNYKDFKKMLLSLDSKPTLLLHCCCGPCSTHTIKVLEPFFQITIYFSNDNIYPEEEYNKRLEEEIKYAQLHKITVVHEPYDAKCYYEAVKGLENLGEHSQRCYNCYKMRLEKTAQYAKEHNFDYFTTSLSISPYKNSDWLNEIGYALEEKYQVKFLYSNFKKEEGYKESIKLSKEFNMYRQDYCGCVFSKRERGVLDD